MRQQCAVFLTKRLIQTMIDPTLAVTLPTITGPVLALIAGILILVRPALLAKIVAI